MSHIASVETTIHHLVSANKLELDKDAMSIEVIKSIAIMMDETDDPTVYVKLATEARLWAIKIEGKQATNGPSIFNI